MAIGAGVLASRALRGGRGSLIGLALVIALGGGAALGAAVAAYRTDHAWEEYVADAEVPELVINPSVRTQEIDGIIRGFDGVERARADALLFASVSITEPTPVAESATSDQWLQTRGTVDGRYVDFDRPAVHEGRVPSGEREVFVSNDYRAELERIVGHDLEVGDTIAVSFFWALTLEALPPDAVAEPLGVEDLRISGFGVLPNEVLPEELFPRQQLIVSEDVTARYTCRPDLDIAALRSAEEAFLAHYPQDCASLYEYWALDLADGVSPASIREQFEAAASALNADFPEFLSDEGVAYFYISQERADLDADVEETTRPAVIALQAFAIVAAAATLTIAGLMVSRQARRDVASQRNLRALGATRAQLTIWSSAPLLVVVAAGLAGAVAIAWAGSTVGPIGSVRSVTPSPGRSLPGAAVLPFLGGLALAMVLVLAAVIARASWLAARPDRPVLASGGRLSRLVGRGRPSFATGVGAALDARRAGAGIAAMLGCVVATATASAAAVFGASLSDLVDDSAAYGWPWDLAIVTGAGYGDTVPSVVNERLAEADVRDDIADVSFYSLDPSIIFGDRPAPVVFGLDGAGDTVLPILEGRMATRVGETVLGAETAEALDLEIGERLTISSLWYGDLDIHIVGIGALPSIGVFVADRAGLDTGAFILVDEPGDRGDPALTAIRVRDGVDPESVLTRLEPDLATFSSKGEPPITHAEPVRSPEIENVSDLRVTPLALGAALLASLAVGLWLAVTLSVRDRRKEVAVLRALGFRDRNVRQSVWWQGLTLVGVGLLFGVPIGIVLGRGSWHLFADRLGVLPTTTVPPLWLAGEVVLVLALGWIAVSLPARRAARLSPSEELLVP